MRNMAFTHPMGPQNCLSRRAGLEISGKGGIFSPGSFLWSIEVSFRTIKEFEKAFKNL